MQFQLIVFYFIFHKSNLIFLFNFIACLYGCSRTKAQEGKPKQVYGALIGKTVGRDIEVMNSFELDYSTVDGLVSSNFEFKFASRLQSSELLNVKGVSA